MAKGKKILISVTAIILAIALALLLVGSAFLIGTVAKEKKAIIILPGLFGSGLINSEDGSFVWDNFEGKDDVSFDMLMNEDGLNLGGLITLLLDEVVLAELGKITANDGAGEPDSLLNMIAMNEDSTPRHPEVVRAPWSVDNRLKYGVVNSLKEMWISLNERYGEEYEVQIFNYDFRLDVRYNAEELEKYINEQGYTDVVLMGHSNGGPVITAYLARSEENRKKVSKFVSFNAPLLGSFSAIGILENMDDMISGIPPAISSLVDVPTIFNKQFKTLINMYTPYQLLPSYEIFLHEYNGELAGYYLDGVRMEFETQEELWEFYCTRPWAKDSEGNLKVPMRDWLEARDSFYVTQKDGSKVFATKLVDTVYINGTNVKGGYQTHFVTDPETGKVNLVKQMINTNNGDGTVVTVSAIAGEADPEDIVLFDGWDHYTILYAFDDVLRDGTYEILDKMVVEKEAEESKNNILATAVATLFSIVIVSAITLALSLPRKLR